MKIYNFLPKGYGQSYSVMTLDLDTAIQSVILFIQKCFDEEKKELEEYDGDFNEYEEDLEIFKKNEIELLKEKYYIQTFDFNEVLSIEVC